MLTKINTHSPFPSKKAITLLKNEPFSVSLAYDPADTRIPPHFAKGLGTYTVELPKVRCVGCVGCVGWMTYTLCCHVSRVGGLCGGCVGCYLE